jgi:hypothetical protein
MPYVSYVAADMGGVVDARHVEIPIVGPGTANLLVIADASPFPGWRPTRF